MTRRVAARYPRVESTGAVRGGTMPLRGEWRRTAWDDARVACASALACVDRRKRRVVRAARVVGRDRRGRKTEPRETKLQDDGTYVRAAPEHLEHGRRKGADGWKYLRFAATETSVSSPKMLIREGKVRSQGGKVPSHRGRNHDSARKSRDRVGGTLMRRRPYRAHLTTGPDSLAIAPGSSSRNAARPRRRHAGQ